MKLSGGLGAFFEADFSFVTSLIASTAAAKVPMAMSNCLETCGKFTIPYPFGMGNPNCYLSQWFEITCSNTFVPRPFLRKFNLEVLDFAFYFNGRGTFMVVNHLVYSTCRDGSSWNSTDLRGSPFIFSSSSNIFMTVGCENILIMNPRKKVFARCCPSACTVESRSSISCQTTIPTDLYVYGLGLTSATVNTAACTSLSWQAPTGF